MVKPNDQRAPAEVIDLRPLKKTPAPLSQKARQALGAVARVLSEHRNEIKLQDVIDVAKHAGIARS